MTVVHSQNRRNYSLLSSTMVSLLEARLTSRTQEQRWQSSNAVEHHTTVYATRDATQSSSAQAVVIPKYLNDQYWWAYVNPLAIRALDRQYLVNMVLWGNASTLCDAALDGLGDEADENGDSTIHGQTLQVACVYGNFTEKLVQRMAPQATLHAIDAVAGQITNLEKKLGYNQKSKYIFLSCANAEALDFDDDSFDQAVVFFLLHEMPNSARIQALKEATRVLRPGGKLVLADFHRPNFVWHKMWMAATFLAYEPYAMDLWNHEITDWLPENMSAHKELLCDGIYQRVVATKH